MRLGAGSARRRRAARKVAPMGMRRAEAEDGCQEVALAGAVGRLHRQGGGQKAKERKRGK